MTAKAKSKAPRRLELGEVFYLPWDMISEYEKNPNVHTDEQIENVGASIRQFGYQQPIVVWWNEAKGKWDIVVGHGRFKSVDKTKYDEIACVKFTGTEEQARAYRIADNRLNMDSDWDTETLVEELQALNAWLSEDENEELLSALGFDEDELDNLLGELDADEDDESSEHVEFDASTTSEYGLYITFSDEASLQKAYDEMTDRGWECKIIS